MSLKKQRRGKGPPELSLKPNGAISSGALYHLEVLRALPSSHGNGNLSSAVKILEERTLNWHFSISPLPRVSVHRYLLVSTNKMVHF